MIGSYEISARLGRLHLQGQHDQHRRRVRLQSGLGNNKPMQNASLTLKARLSVVFPGCLRVKMQRGVASLCDKTNLSSDSGSISIAAMLMIYYCPKSTHKGRYRNRLTGQGFLDVVQGIFVRALERSPWHNEQSGDILSCSESEPLRGSGGLALTGTLPRSRLLFEWK